jgi:hypothetical protein
LQILKQCTVFPNPATDVLNVEMILELNARLAIEIIDLEGRICSKRTLGEVSPGKSLFHIDITNLPDGVYTLNLILSEANTQSSYLYKVVICE